MTALALEAERIAALNALRILDTAPEPDYDDLARLAALVCAAPIAIVTLVDSHRQWFKACIGLPIRETPRDVAFCNHTITQDDLFVVADATTDPRFQGNPLVTGAPHIRFYAGMPLTVPEGHRLGTLCVIDVVPRSLTACQSDALRALARQVVAQLRLRRHAEEMELIAAEKQQLAADLLLCDARFQAISGRARPSPFE